MKKPGLKPAIHPVIRKFLDDKDTVFDLVDGFGSPLNIIFPDHIADNISSFLDVYKRKHIRGTVFYTSKPNKSLSLRKRASLTEAGLDVSSEGELKLGLSCGFHPSRVEATGPKNIDYMRLAVQQGVLINVDSFKELQQLIKLHQTMNLKGKIRILVRVGGFDTVREKYSRLDSAFGINITDIGALYEFLTLHADKLDFIGFSFHFNVSDTARRIVALEKSIELTFDAIERGLKPKGIDIGGGYKISYAESKEAWDNFNQDLKKSILGHIEPFTWNDGGMGYYLENGQIKGSPNFIEHFHDKNGADDFESIIDTPLPLFGGRSAAQILSESLLELYVEPGRASLDQCGLTLSRINVCKKSIHGHKIVMLDMNRTNINAVHMKLMTDPVLIHRSNTPQLAEDGVFYIGNTGLSDDLIQYHKTFPLYQPEEGDVVAFINTAAYHMDFVESCVLQQRLASKVAVSRHDDGFRWFSDEMYSPINFSSLDGDEI